MVKTEKRDFQIREENVKELIKKLESYNIYPEKTNDGFKFMIQSNDNIVYDIEVFIIEKFTLEEQLFMFNAYQHIKSFDDIQKWIFGKIYWK